MWVRKQQYPCQPICLVPKRRQKAICLPSPQIYTYPCQGVDPEGQFSELVSNTGTDAITYTDGSVTAATRYTYRIKAINEHGVSDRSRWFHIDTAAAPAEQTNGESASPPTRTEPEDGDFADSTATTGLVAVGESIVGRIESAADVDWILVQADPGQWFTLTVTGYGEGDHTALETPYQQAYHQPDGSVMVPEHALNKDLTPCSTDCVHAKVSQGGSRFVAVASRADGNTGSYRLTVTLERVHEGVDGGVDLALDVSDGVDTRGFLRMLTPQEFRGFNPAWNRLFGAIPPQDADWYRIDLQAGRAYRFALRETQSDLRLRLRDSGGTTIGSVRSGRTIHAVACAEGAHYIEVFRPDDAPLGITNYVVEAAHTDGLATKALRGNLPNTGQVQLYWQCYGIADSHQVQFRRDGRWTTLSPDGSNPAGIELEYLSEGFAAKVTGLPTGDQYPDYEFRITRVVDGVATTDHREVSIVVSPNTPGNLRGGWNLRYYPDALTFEWDASAGDNVNYEVQIREQQDEEWLDLGSDRLPGLIHRRDGKTRIKILAASPRYVSSPQPAWTRGEHVLMRVRAAQYGQASPWSEPFEVWFADQVWLAAGGSTGRNDDRPRPGHADVGRSRLLRRRHLPADHHLRDVPDGRRMAAPAARSRGERRDGRGGERPRGGERFADGLAEVRVRHTASGKARPPLRVIHPDPVRMVPDHQHHDGPGDPRAARSGADRQRTGLGQLGPGGGRNPVPPASLDGGPMGRTGR